MTSLVAEPLAVSYPYLTCARCQRPTGWVDYAGACDSCGGKNLNPVTRAQSRAYAGAGRFTLSKARREHQRMKAWLAQTGDGGGPLVPERGFSLWIPYRYEQLSQDGSETLLKFAVERAQWDGRRFQPVDMHVCWSGDVKNLPKEPVWDFPLAFSALEPVEELVDAWWDFKRLVHEHNATEWQQLEAVRALDAEQRTVKAIAAEQAALDARRGKALKTADGRMTSAAARDGQGIVDILGCD
jgi:hypothetical protein